MLISIRESILSCFSWYDQLHSKINFQIANCLVNLLWRRDVVGSCIVDGWVDQRSTDVSWVWWIPRNSSERILYHAASLLSNNVNTYLLYGGLQVLHHQGSWVLNCNLRCSVLGNMGKYSVFFFVFLMELWIITYFSIFELTSYNWELMFKLFITI